MKTLEDVIQNANNREYVLEAVKEDGLLLDGASDELKDDKELVMEAVIKDGGALEFASDRLKADREILMQAVEKKAGYYAMHQMS